MTTHSLTATLWDRAAAHDPNDVFRQWRDGAWRGLNWTDVADRVAAVAGGLVALGVDPGDRVALLSGTRVEWSLVDLAILSIDAVTVPIAATAAEEEVAWILRDARPRLAIVETMEHVALVHSARYHGGDLGEAFVLDGGGLDAIVDRGGSVSREEVLRRAAATKPDHAATMIPTSRRGSLRELCMVTHGTLLAAARQATADLRPALGRSDTMLLCTPLADRFARVLQFASLQGDITVGFARSADTVLDDLQSFSPTVAPITAEILTQLFDAVARQAQGPRTTMFDFAVATAVQWTRRARPTPLDTLRRTIADKIVYRDLRDAMGGQVRYCLATAGPLEAHVWAVFAAAGLTVLDGDALADLDAPAAVGTSAALPLHR